MNFIEIQTWPEVPQIGLFASLFSSSFNLPEFDIEDLEEALLLDSSESITNDSTVFAPHRLIPDLIVSLLKGCDLLVKSWPNITASNYQMFLRRIFRHKCEEYNIENPFNTDVDFNSLSLRTKVIILNYLCEFRLDSSDVENITSGLDPDSLRIQPLGSDCNGSTYWYFFGTRLYREDFKKGNNKQKSGSSLERIWQVICFTEEDWDNLTKKFKNSKSRKENSLYKCLSEDFLPNIPFLFKAKEAERRRRLFQKRSSLRVKNLLELKQANNKNSSCELAISTDDDEGNEKVHSSKVIKENESEVKSKIREKLQNDRALRAQRRDSFSSSSGNSNSNNFQTNVEDLCSIDLIGANSLSNKENILIRSKSKLQKKLSQVSTESNFANMAPVTTKPGRQTNNSLSSITGHIVIQPNQQIQNTSASSTRKKKVKAENNFTETDEVLQIGMHKVLQQVKNHDDAWPFMDPVEEDIAPRYYSIIKRPMDLLKMEEKLDNGEYNTFTEFRTDFKLIVNNCRLYNGQNNEYTEMVNNLQVAFDRATRKYFDQSSSDEEQVLLEYPPIENLNKTNKKIQDVCSPQSFEVKKNIKSSEKKIISKELTDDEDGTKSFKLEKNKKISNVQKQKEIVAMKRKSKDTSESVKCKKMKKNDKELKSVNTKNKSAEKILTAANNSKQKLKKKVKNYILKELKPNKKMKNKSIETIPMIKSQKKLKKNEKQNSETYDINSDSSSVHDLINEDSKREAQLSSKKSKNKKKAILKGQEDVPISNLAKKRKKKSLKDDEEHLDKDTFPLADKSNSPETSLISPNSSCTTVHNYSLGEKQTEVKDKFDLIKERRNKSLVDKVKNKFSGKMEKKLKRKIEETKDKFDDDRNSAFDRLLAEKNDEFLAPKSMNKNEKKEMSDSKIAKSSKSLKNKTKDINAIEEKNKKLQKNKQHNKTSLDVLDLETEQTLKDINKWLEHTPRFEYNSASNSPSRYILEDIDMPSKIDDSDFQKPIPLMPSSPTTSKTLQPIEKDSNPLKDTSTCNKVFNSSLNKKGIKEGKRKNAKEKSKVVQIKKDIQRTIDRLQPGKAKGNLLHNIQNINKPEELYILGNREKIKEVKNTLLVETDENSPKLNLGKVLDSTSFSFSNDHRIELDECKDSDAGAQTQINDTNMCKEEDTFELKNEKEQEFSEKGSPKNIQNSESSTNLLEQSVKPNFNAWFKAFGVSKKTKALEIENSKKKPCSDSKNELIFPSNRLRKLSTGSSMSERSSVDNEDSPKIGIEERLGAPAPYPSPIGASPISVSLSLSPKIEEQSNVKPTYTVDGPIRVGFYQDTTSSNKSSPEKSCSPREMLSPYNQYTHQSNAYNTSSASNTNVYSNFYNSETGKQRQQSFVKNPDSTNVYYDQYKQPLSQESDFNSSMSPNPNSPYHSQQSSPYQQQPSSPFQSSNSGSQIPTNTMIANQSPNSPYSQPNSPYQNQASPFNQTSLNSQSSNSSQSGSNQTFANHTQHFAHQSNFNTTFAQSSTEDVSQKILPTSNSTIPIEAAVPQNSVIAPPNQQLYVNPDSSFMLNENLKMKSFDKKTEVQSENLYSTGNRVDPEYRNINAVPPKSCSLPSSEKQPECGKYLDLSKSNHQLNAYQQITEPTNYSKPMNYDLGKSKSFDMFRDMQRPAYPTNIDSCNVSNNSFNIGSVPKSESSACGPVVNNQIESVKDLSKPAMISNILQNTPEGTGSSLMHGHQSIRAISASSSIDINYKQSPLFNAPTASSMMELTAFMRDFRQTDERFSSLPNPPAGFYDKNIPQTHMFGKNLSQCNANSTLQQMFSNPMPAYGREQQEASYQNRINIYPSPNLNQINPDSKSKKQKKKKTAVTESSQQMPPVAHHLQSNAQQPHQQFAHQQSFQSFSGLKIPSSTTNNTDSSSLPIKSVVPGSAFNYGPTPLPGLYGENASYLDEFRGSQNPYYNSTLRPAEASDKASVPSTSQAHTATPTSPYHHLLPSHHHSRSYPFINSIDPATLQQQYRMMLNQTYQAGYHHPALGMHNQPPHWHM